MQDNVNPTAQAEALRQRATSLIVDSPAFGSLDDFLANRQEVDRFLTAADELAPLAADDGWAR